MLSLKPRITCDQKQIMCRFCVVQVIYLLWVSLLYEYLKYYQLYTVKLKFNDHTFNI